MRVFAFIAVACMAIATTEMTYAQVDGFGKDKGQQVEGERDGRRGKGQRRARGERGEKGQRGEKGERGARGEGGQRGGKGRRGQMGGAEMVDMMFSRMDKDKNGQISLAEAPERLQQRFETMDTNGDKSLTKAEMQAAFEKMRGQRGDRGKGMQGKGGKGQRGNAEGGRRSRGNFDPTKMIEMADKNNDGVISIDEAPERMQKNFDRIDADSSGTVTADELKAAMAKMREAGAKGGKGKARGRNKADGGKDKSPEKPKRPPFGDDLS